MTVLMEVSPVFALPLSQSEILGHFSEGPSRVEASVLLGTFHAAQSVCSLLQIYLDSTKGMNTLPN